MVLVVLVTLAAVAQKENAALAADVGVLELLVQHFQKPECICVVLSNIKDVSLMQATKVESKIVQLFILDVVKEWQDRHSIIDIQAKT